MVAMSPIISDEAVNVLLLSVVLLAGVAVQIRYFPWRAGFFANVIDAATSLCFITVVIGAGLLLDIPSVETTERAALLLMLLIAVLAVCGWICGVMDNLLSTRLKPYVRWLGLGRSLRLGGVGGALRRLAFGTLRRLARGHDQGL